MKAIRIITTILVSMGMAFIWACSKEIVYIPDPASIKDPKTIIWRMLVEQPEILIPQDLSFASRALGMYSQKVDVTDDKFKVLTKLPILGGSFSVGSDPKTYVIYYDSIGSVEIYKSRDYYKIMIKNESGKVIYRVATYDLDRAKSFVDALHAMMNRQ
jgi:hypothetical protein